MEFVNEKSYVSGDGTSIQFIADPTLFMTSDEARAALAGWPLGEPDILNASAKVDGDYLDVELLTVGSMDAAVDPLFLVQQGDVSRAANVSFELRAGRANGGTGDWELRLITFADGKERPSQPVTGGSWTVFSSMFDSCQFSTDS